MKKARWGILALGLTLLLSASSFADVEFKGLDTSEIPLLISYIDILVAHLNSSGAPRTRDHITFLNEKKDPVGAIVADFDPKNPLYQLFTQKTIVIQKDDLKNWEKAIQETQKRDLREDIPPEQLHGIVENADSVALDYPLEGPKQEHLVIFNARQHPKGMTVGDPARLMDGLADMLYGETYTRLMDPEFKDKKMNYSLVLKRKIAGIKRTIFVLDGIADDLLKRGDSPAKSGQRLKKIYIPELKKKLEQYQELKSGQESAAPSKNATVRWETSPTPPSVYHQPYLRPLRCPSKT